MTFVRFFLKIFTVLQTVIYSIYFLQKFFESPNKTFHRNQKVILRLFSITPKPKNDHVTVYSRNKES
jgi:flagellar biogenesis protein FliO